MLRDLKMDVFYPYPPQRVWQAIANRRAMAQWLMENDFEPRLGHKFRFQHTTLPGLDGSIDCEVIELDEPKRLSYTWQDKLMHRPSIITWTLNPVDGGTRLQLEHKGLQQQVVKLDEPVRVYQQIHETKAVTQTLPPIAVQSLPIGKYAELDNVILSSFVNGGWEYRLKERLAPILAEVAVSNK